MLGVTGRAVEAFTQYFTLIFHANGGFAAHPLPGRDQTVPTSVSKTAVAGRLQRRTNMFRHTSSMSSGTESRCKAPLFFSVCCTSGAGFIRDSPVQVSARQTYFSENLKTGCEERIMQL